MNSSIHSAAHGPRLHRWWTWIPLVPLLAVGCDGCKGPGPRQLICKSVAYYEVPNPEQGAGKAPFSIERLGREVNRDQPRRRPAALTFTGENHVAVSWDVGALFYESEVIYSPAEGLARDVKDPAKFVFPMKLLSDDKPERARFGFRSEVCRQPVQAGDYLNCDLTENELFLVADMTCRWELIDPREWE